MGRGTFEGTSKNNNFEEALEAAIGAAKEGLRSELVLWQLEETRGENGGIAKRHRATLRRLLWLRYYRANQQRDCHYHEHQFYRSIDSHVTSSSQNSGYLVTKPN